MSKADSTNNPIVLFLLLFAVGMIPWLHGAELDWEIALFTAVFMLLLTGSFISNSVNIFTEYTTVKFPLLLLVSWFVYSCAFLIPLPKELVLLLFPNAPTGSNYLTISKSLTLIEVAKIVCVICAFCLSYQVAKFKRQQRLLLKTMFYSSAVMAIYSQLNHYTNGQFEWIEAIPPWDANWATTVRGTFSYKNQYAIYLAMTIAIGAGLIADDVKRKHQEVGLISFSSVFRHIILERPLFDIVLLLVMLVSFFGADSRGGSLVLVVSTMFILIHYFFRSKKSSWSKKHSSIAVALAVVCTVVFLSSTSFARYEKYGFNDHGRAELHLTAISVIKDYPLFGTGPGTYPAIQHLYKSVDLGNSAMSKHAHNDYLEFLATYGLFGSLLIACALLTMLFKVFYRYPNENVGTLLGSRIAAGCLLMHSAIDFNFGTLALSVTFFVLLAVLLRMTESPKLNECS